MKLPATLGPLEEARALGDRPVALAVGMFDGVHRGHQLVLAQARLAAGDDGLTASLSFSPHPSRVLRPEQAVPLLFPPSMRARQLHATGVDVVIDHPFDHAFSRLPAERFVGLLKDCIPGLRTIVVGENFRFGYRRQGDVAQLKTDAQARGIAVEALARLPHQGDGISSTRIRNAVQTGAMDEAASLLGRPYASEGPVIGGRQLGRTIGFPTLNFAWEPECLPAFGVYVVGLTTRDGRTLPGVANYGQRPTVEQGPASPLLEVHTFGIPPLSTGETATVAWHQRLRGEERFADLDALKAQIARDTETARAWWTARSGA